MGATTAAGGGKTVLSAAFGDTPSTRALRDGRIVSPLLRLEFADIKPISRAFAPMVREGRFDVSEMAIATFLQAKAAGKPIVMVPVVLAARFQEAALLCRTDSDIGGPGDLPGRKIGVRAYSQTTGMWLRGILAEDHGIASNSIRWTTFEDAHVAEYKDPASVTRAAPGDDMMAMLLDGRLDAIIVGNDVPENPAIRTVFRDPQAAGNDFHRKHGFMPVNHLLTVRRGIADRHPEAVGELIRMFREAASIGAPNTDTPKTRKDIDSAISVAIRYSVEQKLLPPSFDPSAVWEGLPPDGR